MDELEDRDVHKTRKLSSTGSGLAIIANQKETYIKV